MRLALALLLTAAGCTPDAAPDAAGHAPDPFAPDSLAGTFEGHYSAGFEHTGLVPCADTTEVWWTEAAATLVPVPGDHDQYRRETAPAAAAFDTAYVALTGYDGRAVSGPVVWARLRGRATPRRDVAAGQGVGHDGAYTRAFAVDSVEVLVRDTTVTGCPAPRRVHP